MNKQTLRALVAVPALALAAATASAQAAGTASSPTPAYGPGYGPGYGMGPGMMGGYGPGGWQRGGPGYGPGAGNRGGPGYGGGWGGYGMGPWMMGGGYGGYGGWGMGPGMMGGGYGGWGMGRGMMDGFGGYGRWGVGPGLAALNLTDAQVKKIEAIEEAQAKKQWALMTQMHDAMISGWRNFDRANIDVDAAMKTAKAVSDVRLLMMRNQLETQKQIQGVLTKEQQQQLRQYGPWGR